MIFFTGIHHPSDAHRVPAAFVSVHAIAKRRSAFPARRVILDSGAFRTIELHGGYPEPVEAYAEQIRKVRGWLGRRLLAAVAQDYMCERYMCATVLGLPVETLPKNGRARECALRLMCPDHLWRAQILVHQRLTIERYDALVACDVAGTRIMPVLQGYAPENYADHVRQYGDRLTPRMLVGVGSVCKRNSNPDAVLAVLLAIKRVRPDLRLHGFGIKLTALGWQSICNLLFSTDSMAWSVAARWAGRNPNDPAEAVRYRQRVLRQPIQLALGHW